MEGNENKYQLSQDDKDYILSTSTIGDKVRIRCQDITSPGKDIYIKDFTLKELIEIDPLFKVFSTPQKAQKEIEKMVENQKVGLSEEENILNLIFYLVIGTEKNNIILPLNKMNKINNFEKNEIQAERQVIGKGGNNKQSFLEPIKDSTKTRSGLSMKQHGVNRVPIEIIEPQPGIKSQIYTSPRFPSSINELSPIEIVQGNHLIRTQIYPPPGFPPTIVNSQEKNIYIEPPVFHSQIPKRTILSPQRIIREPGYATKSHNIMIKPPSSQIIVESPHSHDFDPYFDARIRCSCPVDDIRINRLEGDTFGIRQAHERLKADIFRLANELKKERMEKERLQKQLMNVNTENNSEIVLLRKENESLRIKLYEGNPEDKEEIKRLRIEVEELRKKILEGNPYDREEIIRLKAENKGLLTRISTGNETDKEEIIRLRGEIENLGKRLFEGNPADKEEIIKYQKEIEEMRKISYKGNVSEDIIKVKNEAEGLRRRIKELEEIVTQLENDLQYERTKAKDDRYIYRKYIGLENKKFTVDSLATPEVVKGEIIHSTSEIEFLSKKMNKNNSKITFNLLYKATADSDKASAFHSKCDKAKKSLVLIETDKGRRFGGFTTCSWEGDCVDKKDEDSFIFSLDKSKIYDNIKGDDAIGCYPKFGPIFLGCQIRVYDDAFSKGGSTFEKGLNFDTQEDYELNDGERTFGIKELEVYEVITE